MGFSRGKAGAERIYELREPKRSAKQWEGKPASAFPVDVGCHWCERNLVRILELEREIARLRRLTSVVGEGEDRSCGDPSARGFSTGD
jgi:hypothetical protein